MADEPANGETKAAEGTKEAPVIKGEKSFTDRWPFKVIFPIATLCIGAGVSWGITQYNGRLRALPYIVSSTSGMIRKPDFAANDIQVLIKGKPTDNISSTVFAIFNNTDQDFEDVDLRLTFKATGDKPPAIIQANIHTPRDEYDESALPTTTTADNTVRVGYRLHVVNRSSKAVFEVAYLFEGGTAPDVSVTIQKKGLQAVQFDPSKQSGNNGSLLWIAAIVFVPGLCILFAVNKIIDIYFLRRMTKNEK